MELLQHYKGAVFFVDILGISALTNNNIALNHEDYRTWLNNNIPKFSNQFLGASILAEFRKLLLKLRKGNTSLKITQLSDCAFIWSEQIADVVVFCSKFMHQAVEKGILCRGGMAFGEIIETNQSHRLGRFILGDAVTQAAKLESRSKGCRVLINSDLPQELDKQSEDVSKRIFTLFQPFTNPLDFQVYDEFKWYLTPKLDYKNIVDLNFIDFDTRVKFTKNRLILANRLRCSPKFNWNSRSILGRAQLIASINFLSQNYTMGVLHNFGWVDVIDKRDEKVVEKMNKKLNEYPDYRKHIDEPFPEDWAE
ncbi:hypothetical protein [Gillisia limnaea]|uniref:Guanylate cyclase domain-containing protein n=1 Tax=Gillisia limnaea (strain DSM 15749 / LMG 21470 / R-8282) TaxID=865937 RepID=H2BXK8_GILLR|nr:hypothetical protein [Gillisia limnaea]EHQ03132.1 hypothetical protein Gilli_2508 [Gillisia limnaea DSM 15749]